MRATPNTVIALIEELEVDYPPKCKSHNESPEEHAEYAGKVELIRHLRARYTAELKVNQKGLPKVL